MGKHTEKLDLSLRDVGDVRNIEGVTMPEYPVPDYQRAAGATKPQVDPWSLAVRRTPPPPPPPERSAKTKTKEPDGA